MRSNALATTTWIVSVSLVPLTLPSIAKAADLAWEVESPFRFFKRPQAFDLHDAHTVAVKLAPERLAEVPSGDCVWSFQPRAAGAKPESKKQACKDKFVIRRVPYSRDASHSGGSVKVQLPDGRELVEANVA